MAVFSILFKRAAKSRSNRATEDTSSDSKETRSVYAELESAASNYAAQLEKATRELGYTLNEYEETGACPKNGG